MRTYTTTTPDGRVHVRRSAKRTYTHAVQGLGTTGRWHASFASSADKAEREAATQRNHGIQAHVVAVDVTAD